MPLHAHRLPAVAFVLVLASCGGDGDDDLGPTLPLKAMTRNLFLGGEFSSIIMAPSKDELPGRVAMFWQAVKESDFPARAKLLAQEIAEAAPDLVGLQEVELFRTQRPSDFDFANPQINADPGKCADATACETIDFLAILMNELAALGASYVAVAQATHTDAELPGTGEGGMLFDLRLTDRDVILARADLAVSNPQGASFPTYILLPVGGQSGVTVRLARGYTSIDAQIGETLVTFVNTHLEVGGQLAGAYQVQQARDLLKVLAPVSNAMVLVGDLNSSADNTSTRSYAEVTKVFKDAWARVRGGDAGATCCSDLRSPMFTARSRIDFVMYRGRVGAESAEIVGTNPDRRTPSGLWPSDHAGVVSTLQIAQ